MSFRLAPNDSVSLMKDMLRRLDDLERKRDCECDEEASGGVALLTAGDPVVQDHNDAHGANFVIQPGSGYSRYVTIGGDAVTPDYAGQSLAMFHSALLRSVAMESMAGAVDTVIYLNEPTENAVAALGVANYTMPGGSNSPPQTIVAAVSPTITYGSFGWSGVFGARHHGIVGVGGYQAPGAIVMPQVYSPGPGWLIVYCLHVDMAALDPPDSTGGTYTGTILPPASTEFLSGTVGGEFSFRNRLTKTNGVWLFFEYAPAAGLTPERTFNVETYGVIPSTHILDTR